MFLYKRPCHVVIPRKPCLRFSAILFSTVLRHSCEGVALGTKRNAKFFSSHRFRIKGCRGDDVTGLCGSHKSCLIRSHTPNPGGSSLIIAGSTSEIICSNKTMASYLVFACGNDIPCSAPVMLL